MVSFLALGLGGRSQPFSFGEVLVYLSQSLHPDYTKRPIRYNRIGSEIKKIIFAFRSLHLDNRR